MQQHAGSWKIDASVCGHWKRLPGLGEVSLAPTLAHPDPPVSLKAPMPWGGVTRRCSSSTRPPQRHLIPLCFREVSPAPAPTHPNLLVSLTPGSVFCSCRALCAFSAESRAQ